MMGLHPSLDHYRAKLAVIGPLLHHAKLAMIGHLLGPNQTNCHFSINPYHDYYWKNSRLHNINILETQQKH